jgi:hypothetical protein
MGHCPSAKQRAMGRRFLGFYSTDFAGLATASGGGGGARELVAVFCFLRRARHVGNHIMLPLSLLRTAAGHPMVRSRRPWPYRNLLTKPHMVQKLTDCRMLAPVQLVELKNGETYNGELVACDNWMNIRCVRAHVLRLLCRRPWPLL